MKPMLAQCCGWREHNPRLDALLVAKEIYIRSAAAGAAAAGLVLVLLLLP
jgi:hypothetical protein